MAKYWNLRGQVVVLNSNAIPLSTLLPTKLVAEAQGRVDWFRRFFALRTANIRDTPQSKNLAYKIPE
jgi:hypothetical protein